MLNQESIRESRGSALGRPRKNPEPRESGESSRPCSEVSGKDGTTPWCYLLQHPLWVHLLCLLSARLVAKCELQSYMRNCLKHQGWYIRMARGWSYEIRKAALDRKTSNTRILLEILEVLWPPDAKNRLIRKDPDAGKDWRREEKGMTEDEMVGWPTQWTWVWVSSGSWWWTGKPGVLQSMGLQRPSDRTER